MSKERRRAEFPAKLAPLFRPHRYKIAYGGRGGSKSWGIARALILLAAQKPIRVLCARELQTSIQESVHRLLADQIDALGLGARFLVQQKGIYGVNGSDFIFSGIRNNPTKIKSTEGVDMCWVEEAEKVSDSSWEILIPTIRKPGSEIWITFNPSDEDDPTYKRFIVNPPPDSVLMPISWRDNPWFPEELRKEKDYLARVDWQAYLHVWEGHCRTTSDAQVLKGKWRVEGFEPQKDWAGPYFGADWGFSTDPTALSKSWIAGRTLYIEHEAYGVGVEIDGIPAKFSTIPDAKNYVIRADNARPETISYLQRNGFPKLTAARKWPGSVEDGVEFLRSFESIVIHPRCRHAAEEARLWSFKTDRLSGDVLPQLAPGHDHVFDAIRYSLEPVIAKRTITVTEFNI